MHAPLFLEQVRARRAAPIAPRLCHHREVTRIAVLLALLASVLAAVPADARVRVRGEDLRRATVQACDAERRAVVAPEGARVVARSERRLVVDRCVLGRWKRMAVRRHRAVLPTGAPADLRVRSRRSRPRFVRVGVGEVADVPVEFDVVNRNTSQLACATDGERYVIRGRLVAPVAELAARAPAATLILHGVDAAGYLHLRRAPDVDLARQLADRGRAVVIVDRLGYGRSGRAPGDGSCLGGPADTSHQVLERLRAGTYRAAGLEPVAFRRLALAGHSGGGPVAQLAAYSFPGIDALVVMAWADQNFQPALAEGMATGEGSRCSAQPDGYAYVFNVEAWRKYPEARLRPRVLALAEAGRFPNPCGDLTSILAAPALDTARLGEVRVPVLLAHGRFDALFGDGSGQREHFTGSDDVTRLVYEGGHSYFLEDAIARRAQDDLSAWLADRGF